MLKVKKIFKSFEGVKAVKNCSFEIPKGKITALIGPNGAGKSTIFNIISGVSSADKGSVLFKNKQLLGLSIEEISEIGISRLFQDVKLFSNLTVRQNLLLALSQKDTFFWCNFFGVNNYTIEDNERVSQILKTIEMKKFQNIQAKELSYGQKKLVGIGRAILNPHQFLMLDEPVAGINPKLREKISSILSQLKKAGSTILLIEHDMIFTLKLADYVVVLDAGKVIFSGSPSAVKKNKRVIEAYLGK